MKRPPTEAAFPIKRMRQRLRKLRAVKRRWIRDVIADCREHGISVFHKQWGSYQNNPLVANKGLSVDDAKRKDGYGKGGGLIDGLLIREFPVPKATSKRGNRFPQLWPLFDNYPGT